VLVLDNGRYDISVDIHCPNTLQTAKSPLHVTLSSQKAYYVLVSGEPPRAKLVSYLFIAVSLFMQQWLTNCSELGEVFSVETVFCAD